MLIIVISSSLSITKADDNTDVKLPPTEDQCARLTDGGKMIYDQYISTLSIFWHPNIALESIEDIWNDMTKRNFCWTDDIFSQMQTVDSISTGIRNAIYNCDIERFNELKQEYVDAQMELFYLRNMAEPRYSFTPRSPDQIRSRFNERFKGKLKSEDLERYLRDFGNIYGISENPKDSKKLSKYTECKILAFEDLKKKWNKFMDTMAVFKGEGSLAEDIKQKTEEELAIFDEKISGWGAKDKSYDNNDNTQSGLWGAIKDRLSIKVNDKKIQPLDIFDAKDKKQFLKQMGEDLGESVGGKETLEDANIFSSLDLYEKSKQDYEAKINMVQSLATSDVQYAQGSEIITASFFSQAYNTNNILGEMTKNMNEWQKCAHYPIKRQCSNKKIDIPDDSDDQSCQ